MGVPVLQLFFQGITCFAASGGLAFVVVNFWGARKQRKRDFIEKYFAEYRNDDFGLAVQDLWQLYADSHFKEAELVKNYIRLAKKDNWHLHLNVRRKVSAFYQEAGILAQDKDIMDMFLKGWSSSDLRLIKEILIPLELKAVPEVMVARNIPDDNEKSIGMTEWRNGQQAMAALYNEALRREADDKKKKLKAGRHHGSRKA
jgi:hypothetical protein